MHITQSDGGTRSKEWRSRNLCLAQFSLRLCQRFRENPAIVSVHRTSRDDNCSLAHHAYFAEQLSLLRCAVRYMRVRTRLRIATRWRKALAHAGVRCMNGESPCCDGGSGRKHPPFGPTSTFTFDDNCFCVCHCVSAADQLQFFPDAPLSPNMRTQILGCLVAADPPSAAY